MQNTKIILNNSSFSDISRIWGGAIKILLHSSKLEIYCKQEKAAVYLNQELRSKGMECLRRKNKDSFVVEIPFNQSFYDYKGLNLELIFEENNITKISYNKEADLAFALKNYGKSVKCCFLKKVNENGSNIFCEVEKVIDGNFISLIENGTIINVRL